MINGRDGLCLGSQESRSRWLEGDLDRLIAVGRHRAACGFPRGALFTLATTYRNRSGGRIDMPDSVLIIWPWSYDYCQGKRDEDSGGSVQSAVP